jgi:transcriptional regulator with XRE-family HTH domain
MSMTKKEQKQYLRMNHRVMIADIVRLRIIHGISQKTVAERMGTTVKEVQTIETANLDLRLSTLRRYALACEVVIDHQVIPTEDMARIDPQEGPQTAPGATTTTDPAPEDPDAEKVPQTGVWDTPEYETCTASACWYEYSLICDGVVNHATKHHDPANGCWWEFVDNDRPGKGVVVSTEVLEK